MANSQTSKPTTKPKSDDAILTNEHNQKEHEAKIARKAEEGDKLGDDGLNDHNRREHEEKLARQANRNS